MGGTRYGERENGELWLLWRGDGEQCDVLDQVADLLDGGEDEPG